jgi:citrate/tricarballylate utilization protein
MPFSKKFLALHLGIVFSLFPTMPYGNFVDSVYRLAALIRHIVDLGRAEQSTKDI